MFCPSVGWGAFGCSWVCICGNGGDAMGDGKAVPGILCLWGVA